MRKIVYGKLFHVFLLIVVAALSGYPTDIRLADGGGYEKLPEERKREFGKIIKEFDGEIKRIDVNDKNRRGRITLSFDFGIKDRKLQNRHLENFVNTIRSVKDAGSDSTSIKNAIEKCETEGLKLIMRAGYPEKPGFSLKLNWWKLKKFGGLSNQRILKWGHMVFDEYYNGIKIEYADCIISFIKGQVRCISFDIFAADAIPIAKSEPEITFHEALEKYVSSLKKQIKIDEKPRGNLCYILSSDNSLALCWKIYLHAGVDSRYVYINATTGKTEREDSDVKRSMISGKVKGYKYEVGKEEPQAEQKGIANLTVTIEGPRLAEYWNKYNDIIQTNANGGYQFTLPELGGYDVYTALQSMADFNTWCPKGEKCFKVYGHYSSGNYIDKNPSSIGRLIELTADEPNNYEVDLVYENEQNVNGNVFFCMTDIIDFYNSNWDEEFKDWEDPDDSKNVVNVYVYQDEDCTQGASRINLTESGAKFGTSICHEYNHLMVLFYWGEEVMKSSNGETWSLEEAMCDYIACNCFGVNTMYGLGEYKRSLSNKMKYSDYEPITKGDDGNYHEASQILSGSLYDATQNKTVKWNVMKKLIWSAGNFLLQEKKNLTFSTYLSGLIYMDYLVFDENNDPVDGNFPTHAKELCKAFTKHGIKPGWPLEEDYCEKCLEQGWAPIVQGYDVGNGKITK